MNDMHDVWAHPQLQARAPLDRGGHAGGPIPALLPPGAADAFEPRMDAVPALGQHTDSILESLGWSRTEIQALQREGAI